MARIKILLAYEGTDFCGWQHQAGQRSVQSVVEAAVAKVAVKLTGGARIPVHGAGRTDSGVHALGQCAHFDAPDILAHIPWTKALNSLMGEDVRVVSHELAPPGFHARFDALSKTYAYTLWLDPAPVCPLRRRFVWGVRQALDLAAMDEAAAMFVGTHDFNSFRNQGTPIGARGTVRTLTRLWREPGPGPGEIVWRFEAKGFLKQMVRNLMGCLVAVGKAKVSLEEVRSILERRDRNHLLPTAPPWGLCMERIDYPEPDPTEGGAAGDGAARGQDTAHDEHQMAGHDRRGPDGPDGTDREPAD